MTRYLLLLICLLGLPFASHAAEDILCPDAVAEGKTTPGDMAGVQADIERLNLCVERAKLLKQLDDVVRERQDILKKVSSPEIGMPSGGAVSGIPGIPPLPSGSLPSVKGVNTEDLKPGEVRINAPSGNPLDTAVEPAPESLVAVPAWQIRKIWGQGATMRAQLTDSSGTIVNVIKGDPLPDGAVIETVSVKGVTVSRNSKITDLSWEQVTDSKSSPPGS